MKKIKFIATMQGKVVKVADTFEEAYKALPEISIIECDGNICSQSRIIYHDDNNKENNNECESFLKMDIENKYIEMLSYIQRLSDKDFKQMITSILQSQNGENEVDFLKIKESINLNKIVENVIELIKESSISLLYGKDFNGQLSTKFERDFAILIPSLTHKIKANFSQLCNVAYLKGFKNNPSQNGQKIEL